MAKKSRRARRRRAKRTASKPQPASEPVGGAQGALVEASGLSRVSRATTASLTEQYGYVYDDLKRIAILAGAMFAILIALAFVVG